MLFHRREATKSMFKQRALGLFAAALLLAAPTVASAHDWHGGGWHGHHGHGHSDWHAHGFAPFVGIPVPVPVAYAPRPLYVAAPYPPRVYAAPAYPGYYPPTVYAPAPVISVRTPHVAVSIGGFFPFPF
jgi:hypothetical protein